MRIALLSAFVVGAFALGYFASTRSASPISAPPNIAFGNSEGLAPVTLIGFFPDDEDFRKMKIAYVRVADAAIVTNGTEVLLRDLPANLNGRVLAGEIEYVAVIPSKGTRWGEIISVVAECRKATVRGVLLNQYDL